MPPSARHSSARDGSIASRVVPHNAALGAELIAFSGAGQRNTESAVLATSSATVASAAFTLFVLKYLEHRMGFEPMNTGFAGEKSGLFSVTYGK
jgi:hypothetical protein